jgi:rhodanese-related sulfurtransferase
MTRFQCTLILIAILTGSLLSYAGASHKGPYPVKQQHSGIDIKPREAFSLIEKTPGHVFIVDVRTRFEYQDIGHAEGSYNIPLLFFSREVGDKGYKKLWNNNFCHDLKARFKPESDSLLMICRSGERSTIAVHDAIECGFKKEKVYNILGGFEGDKVHEDTSPFYGKRMVGGWRLEGLPWTYKMVPELMYLPDVK